MCKHRRAFILDDPKLLYDPEQRDVLAALAKRCEDAGISALLQGMEQEVAALAAEKKRIDGAVRGLKRRFVEALEHGVGQVELDAGLPNA